MVRTTKRIYNFIARKTNRVLHSNCYWNWYVFTPSLCEDWRVSLSPAYSNKGVNTPIKDELKSVVVCVYDGKIESGGWADRLKGILSTYQVCKEARRDFKLLFCSPFELTDYLVPNTYDWSIDRKDVIFNSTIAHPIVLQIGQESAYQARKQYNWLKAHIEAETRKQVHVFTNAMFSYNADFKTLFHELFKPSQRLKEAIEKQTQLLGNEYVSVSVRFIEALGDFEDTQKTEPLPKHLKEKLINDCMSDIEAIHRENPKVKLLVNSDSITFLEVANSLDYTYVIPGEIHHLDVNTPRKDYSQHEKTFLDFFMIANAKKVYRIDRKWTHKSGFPYAAAKTTDAPFEIIKQR